LLHFAVGGPILPRFAHKLSVKSEDKGLQQSCIFLLAKKQSEWGWCGGFFLQPAFIGRWLSSVRGGTTGLAAEKIGKRSSRSQFISRYLRSQFISPPLDLALVSLTHPHCLVLNDRHHSLLSSNRANISSLLGMTSAPGLVLVCHQKKSVRSLSFFF